MHRAVIPQSLLTHEARKWVTVVSWLILAVCPQFGISQVRHADGAVRLVPGPAAGQLQIFTTGQWQHVCSSSSRPLDTALAAVACRQLGFEAASLVHGPVQAAEECLGAPHVETRWQWWCIGSETRVTSCRRSVASNACGCSGSEALVVQCTQNHGAGVERQAAVKTESRQQRAAVATALGLLQAVVDAKFGQQKVAVRTSELRHQQATVETLPSSDPTAIKQQTEDETKLRQQQTADEKELGHRSYISAEKPFARATAMQQQQQQDSGKHHLFSTVALQQQRQRQQQQPAVLSSQSTQQTELAEPQRARQHLHAHLVVRETAEAAAESSAQRASKRRRLLQEILFNGSVNPGAPPPALQPLPPSIAPALAPPLPSPLQTAGTPPPPRASPSSPPYTPGWSSYIDTVLNLSSYPYIPERPPPAPLSPPAPAPLPSPLPSPAPSVPLAPYPPPASPLQPPAPVPPAPLPPSYRPPQVAPPLQPPSPVPLQRPPSPAPTPPAPPPAIPRRPPLRPGVAANRPEDPPYPPPSPPIAPPSPPHVPPALPPPPTPSVTPPAPPSPLPSPSPSPPSPAPPPLPPPAPPSPVPFPPSPMYPPSPPSPSPVPPGYTASIAAVLQLSRLTSPSFNRTHQTMFRRGLFAALFSNASVVPQLYINQIRRVAGGGTPEAAGRHRHLLQTSGASPAPSSGALSTLQVGFIVLGLQPHDAPTAARALVTSATSGTLSTSLQQAGLTNVLAQLVGDPTVAGVPPAAPATPQSPPAPSPKPPPPPVAVVADDSDKVNAIYITVFVIAGVVGLVLLLLIVLLILFCIRRRHAPVAPIPAAATAPAPVVVPTVPLAIVPQPPLPKTPPPLQAQQYNTWDDIPHMGPIVPLQPERPTPQYLPPAVSSPTLPSLPPTAYATALEVPYAPQYDAGGTQAVEVPLSPYGFRFPPGSPQQLHQQQQAPLSYGGSGVVRRVSIPGRRATEADDREPTPEEAYEEFRRNRSILYT